MLIAFYGIDGSGKDTQAKLLADYLEKKGYKVVITREPWTDHIFGRLVRLCSHGHLKIPNEAFPLLFTADRIIHYKNLIEPLLSSDYIVITIRYKLTTLAYQSVKGFDLCWLELLDRVCRDPDIAFILDVPAKVALARKGKLSSIYEKDTAYLEEVRKKFVELASKKKNHFIIDGNRSIEEIHKEIVTIVEKFLGDKDAHKAANNSDARSY